MKIWRRVGRYNSVADILAIGSRSRSPGPSNGSLLQTKIPASSVVAAADRSASLRRGRAGPAPGPRGRTLERTDEDEAPAYAVRARQSSLAALDALHAARGRAADRLRASCPRARSCPSRSTSRRASRSNDIQLPGVQVPAPARRPRRRRRPRPPRPRPPTPTPDDAEPRRSPKPEPSRASRAGAAPRGTGGSPRATGSGDARRRRGTGQQARPARLRLKLRMRVRGGKRAARRRQRDPQRRRLAHPREPRLRRRAARARRRSTGRAELRHPQVPGAAVPAADLPGGRHRVRRPLGGPGGDQRDRDRLRPQPERLLRRRARAGCSSCPSTWQTYGTDANKDGRKDPYNPVDAIFAAARYLKAAGYEDDVRQRDLRLQPRRLVRRLRDAARTPDRRRPRRPRRLAHRPHRGPLPRLRTRPLRRRPRRDRGGSSASSAARTPPTSSSPTTTAARSTSSPARARPVVAANDGVDQEDRPQQAPRPLHRAPGRLRQPLHYAHLGSVVASTTRCPRTTPTTRRPRRARAEGQRADEASDPKPTAAASAGRQPAEHAERAGAKPRTHGQRATQRQPQASVPVKQRLFAHPDMPQARGSPAASSSCSTRRRAGRQVRDLPQLLLPAVRPRRQEGPPAHASRRARA